MNPREIYGPWYPPGGLEHQKRGRTQIAHNVMSFRFLRSPVPTTPIRHARDIWWSSPQLRLQTIDHHAPSIAQHHEESQTQVTVLYCLKSISELRWQSDYRGTFPTTRRPHGHPTVGGRFFTGSEQLYPTFGGRASDKWGTDIRSDEGRTSDLRGTGFRQMGDGYPTDEGRTSDYRGTKISVTPLISVGSWAITL